MNKGRTVMRIVLVVMLIGLVTIGYLIFAKSQPNYHFNRAKRSIKNEDWSSARIHLRNLLRKHPTHSEGHREMASTILKLAELEGHPSFLGAQPGALHHMDQAAQLEPDDFELQKQVLNGYVNARQLDKASDYAIKVYEREPLNPDAHYVMLWRAVNSRDEKLAKELFESMPKVTSARPFQSLYQKAKYHHIMEEDKEYEETMALVAKFAEDFDAETLGLLAQSDRRAMLQLLLNEVNRAEDPTVAHRRAVRVVEVCEKLSKNDLLPKDQIGRAAAQAVGILNIRHPVVVGSPDARALRSLLAERAGVLAARAVDEGTASALTYWQAAQDAFSADEDDRGLKILNSGIDKLTKQNPDQPGINDLRLLAARRLIVLRRFVEAEAHLTHLLDHEKFAGWGYLLRGSVALHQGRLEIALRDFEQAQRKLGPQLKVRMGLAHTYMALQQWEKAIPLLESLDDQPFEELPIEEQAWAKRLLGSGERIHFDLLRANLAIENWKDAQGHLEQLKETPLESKAWILAIAFQWQEGVQRENDQYKKNAVTLLTRARDKFPDDIGLLMLQVRLLEEEEKKDDAKLLIESFAAAQPDDFVRQMALARWRLRRNHVREALSQLQELRNNPELSSEQRRAVNVYLTQGLIATRQTEQALAMIEELRKDPSAATAADLLEVARSMREGNWDRAAAAMERTTDLAPNSGAISLTHAKMAGARGDWEAAVDSASRSLDVTKMRDQSLAVLSQSLGRMAQTQGIEKAIAKLDSIIERYPREFSLLAMRADFHFRKGEIREGMSLLQKAEAVAPKDQLAGVILMNARAYLNQGNVPKVKEEIERAVAQEPDSMSVLLAAGRIYLAAEEYPSALKYAKQAGSLDSKMPDPYYIGAQAYRKMDRHDDAVKWMQVLVQQRPEDIQAVLSLASALEAADRGPEALETIRAARLKHPDDFRFAISHVNFLLKLEQPQAALRIAQESVATAPTAAKYLALAQAFHQTDQLDAAQSFGEKSLSAATRSEKPPVQLFLGKTYLKRAKAEGRDSLYTLAKNAFEEVLVVQPRNLVAGNNLASLLATQFNRPAEAVNVIERVFVNQPTDRLPAEMIDTLVVAYHAAGQTEKAKQILQEGLKRHSDNELLQGHARRLNVKLSSTSP